MRGQTWCFSGEWRQARNGWSLCLTALHGSIGCLRADWWLSESVEWNDDPVRASRWPEMHIDPRTHFLYRSTALAAAPLDILGFTKIDYSDGKT